MLALQGRNAIWVSILTKLQCQVPKGRAKYPDDKKGLQKIQDICAVGHGAVYVIFHMYLKGFF